MMKAFIPVVYRAKHRIVTATELLQPQILTARYDKRFAALAYF